MAKPGFLAVPIFVTMNLSESLEKEPLGKFLLVMQKQHV
jgi:hypothetical protein